MNSVLVPIEPTEAMVEAAALAAWLAYARGDSRPEDWWSEDDWHDYREPEHQWTDWPEGCTHIGADGFRRCARAALAAAPQDDGWNSDMEAARLREAIGRALLCTPQICVGQEGYMIEYDCGDPWQILRDALAASPLPGAPSGGGAK